MKSDNKDEKVAEEMNEWQKRQLSGEEMNERQK